MLKSFYTNIVYKLDADKKKVYKLDLHVFKYTRE